MSIPTDVGRLEPWAFETRRVDKPWGHELIWALSDVYCGKVLFVKAGQSLSLQYHDAKDESWLIQSGRAKIELGAVGDDNLVEETPQSTTRRSSRFRLPRSTTSSASPTATAEQAPPKRRWSSARRSGRARVVRQDGSPGVRAAESCKTLRSALPTPRSAVDGRPANLHKDVVRFGGWQS
jgi:Mannose-6-phosphate isomerase